MSSKLKNNSRKMMELAVEVMQQSISERRTDDKASPLVGAVLVKLDGTIETAFRGELREGDHAEFTLLERKNRANKLDGSVLYATLEPCAPRARNHPKLGCAERIVNARIKEVWVGIEDPDPTVDRKGIKFLQGHGITVHMFDRDLQEIIQTENKGFIAQALERKAAAEEEKVAPLSKLANAANTSDTTDLSQEVLESYRGFAKISEGINSLAFQRLLVQQGLLQAKGKNYIPAGYGMLLFGKSPRAVMPQAGLLGTIHYPDGSEEVRDFDGPMVLVPEQAMQWLKDKLPNPIDRSGAQRKDIADKFYELVRESIVNALVHRDYDIAGAKCQLVVTPDTIVIMSPGAPVEPITLAQLQSFKAPMLSRNPLLHYVFAKMKLAEERGLGLKSMLTLATEAELPLPTYSWNAPYLTLTLFRSSSGVVRRLPPAILSQLNDDEQTSWEFISGKQIITSAELKMSFSFDERKAQRILKKLQDAGLLRRAGSGPATHYEVVQP